MDECRHLKRIFEKFSLLARCLIKRKSSILLSPNVQADVFAKLKAAFQLEVVSHHEKYFSLPSMLGRSKYQNFSELKEKFCNKVNRWKSMLFSSDDKKVLIKVVA